MQLTVGPDSYHTYPDPERDGIAYCAVGAVTLNRKPATLRVILTRYVGRTVGRPECRREDGRPLTDRMRAVAGAMADTVADAVGETEWATLAAERRERANTGLRDAIERARGALDILARCPTAATLDESSYYGAVGDLLGAAGHLRDLRSVAVETARRARLDERLTAYGAERA